MKMQNLNLTQTAFYPRIKGKFRCVPFEDVLYISANNNYSEIFTTKKEKLFIYASLGHLEDRLPETFFCRIHRCYIISLLKIQAFDHSSILIDKQQLPIGRTYFDRLPEHLIMIFDEHKKGRNKDQRSIIRKIG